MVTRNVADENYVPWLENSEEFVKNIFLAF